MTTSHSDRPHRPHRPAWPAPAGWLALALGLAGPVASQELRLPSGLAATLYDVVLEASGGGIAPDAFTDPEAEMEEGIPDDDTPLDAPPEALADMAMAAGIARFRLLVPGLGGAGADYDTVAGDFAWLCGALALPALAANGWTPAEVVITLSDREVPFGRSDPEAVQYFEGFRIAEGACLAQAF